MTNAAPAGRWDRSIIDNARRCARSTRNDWPGQPLAQLPLDAGADLRRLIADGTVRIVERPKALQPSETVAFVVAAS